MSEDAPHIPLAELEELVAQYHHRLLSLEADLKDRARAGGITPAAFAKRVKRLKEVHRELNALQRLCIASTPGKLTSTDIGLPVLDECTPEERQVVEVFLEEREMDVLDLEAESGRVYGWLQDAIAGRSGALRITLRLSKLRRFIQTYEKRAQTLKEESKVLGVHVEKLLGQVSGSVGRDVGRSTLDALMEIFQRLESTISRVAKLKASVKREESKTDSMAAWLEEQETLIREARPSMSPPTPLATAQAARAIPTGTLRAIAKTSRRRALVERFWESVLGPAAAPKPEPPSRKEQDA